MWIETKYIYILHAVNKAFIHAVLLLRSYMLLAQVGTKRTKIVQK